jgi:hypothetical protein
MNLMPIYYALIERGKIRTKTKGDGLHTHRIVPGYAGGKYELNNITFLTPKEHRIIHYIRYRIFGHRADIYSYIRLRGSFSGHTHSEETKQKIANAGKGSKNHFFGKTHSQESREKIKRARSKQVISEKHKQRLSELFKGEGNPRFGKPVSETTRKKISSANQGKRRSETVKALFSFQRKGKLTGGKNPAACPVTLNGITYPCKKQACVELNISLYHLNKLLSRTER